VDLAPEPIFLPAPKVKAMSSHHLCNTTAFPRGFPDIHFGLPCLKLGPPSMCLIEADAVVMSLRTTCGIGIGTGLRNPWVSAAGWLYPTLAKPVPATTG